MHMLNSTAFLKDEDFSPTTCIIPSENILPAHDLQEGLPAEEVHRRACGARKGLARAQRALCFWLVEMEKRALYRHFGCSSVFHYGEQYLELAPHTIAEYLRSGKEMAKLPLLAAACAKGEISPSKVREISRVAIPETEHTWLEVARSSTYRQIEKLVPMTPKGGLPPESEHRTTGTADIMPASTAGKKVVGAEEGQCKGTDVINEQCAGPSRYNTKLFLELENESMAIIALALKRARQETGERDRGALLEHICRAFLDQVPAGGGGSSNGKGSGSPYRVTIHHNPSTGVAWTGGGALPGPLYVPGSMLEEALCDAEIVDLEEPGALSNEEQCHVSGDRYCCIREEPSSPNAPEDPARDRDSSKDPWRHGPRLRRTIPPTLRRQVLERDEHQCTVPGCGHTRFLALHHIIPRECGGEDSARNLTTTCFRCHRALHRGLLKVEGDAPRELAWKNRHGIPLKR